VSFFYISRDVFLNYPYWPTLCGNTNTQIPFFQQLCLLLLVLGCKVLMCANDFLKCKRSHRSFYNRHTRSFSNGIHLNIFLQKNRKTEKTEKLKKSILITKNFQKIIF
jgi:hypothetical protein